MTTPIAHADAAKAIAIAILGADHPSRPALTTSLISHPTIAAYAAGTIDRDDAVRAIVDGACDALRARAALLAEHRAAKRQAA